MNITEFLEARIAEDEAAIERRGGQAHEVHLFDVFGTFNPQCPDCLGLPGSERVRGECQAKRNILRRYLREPANSAARYAAACLALVYRDQPDYAPTWSHNGG